MLMDISFVGMSANGGVIDNYVMVLVIVILLMTLTMSVIASLLVQNIC